MGGYFQSLFLDDFKNQQSHIYLRYTILNTIKVYEESVSRTKNIPHRVVKFEVSEENRIVHESLYWFQNYFISLPISKVDLEKVNIISNFC